MADIIPRPNMPYTSAAADLLQQQYGAQAQALVQSALGQLEQGLQRICSAGNANAGATRQYSPVTAQLIAAVNPGATPGANPGPWYPPGGPGRPCAGGCGGSCGGGCGGGSTQFPPPQNLPPGMDPPPGYMPPTPPGGWFPPNQPCNPMSPMGIPRGTVPLLNQLPPKCYNCACIDPCLYPALAFARQNFDQYQWLLAMENDGMLVHLNVNAGGVGFNTPPVPLLANTESFFAQQVEQVLPYIPGLVKVNVTFDGVHTPGAVKLQFYTGPNPTLTGVTPAQLSATGGQFAVAGRAFELTDFECGDACYVQEFPKFMMCTPGPIPYTRALYVRVTVGALPADTTITSLTITILKQGTRSYANCCKQFGFDMYGPASGGCNGQVYQDPYAQLWSGMLQLG